ncbi:MAG: hypothetical protein CMK08_11520 [Ponticaulis sp.]|nr:hypothetical protein [Ponticaulis sp.]|tara:strand:- start:940 stop:1125 length:186 start_codon:yes stop_codon:yes gene_type:complete
MIPSVAAFFLCLMALFQSIQYERLFILVVNMNRRKWKCVWIMTFSPNISFLLDGSVAKSYF